MKLRYFENTKARVEIIPMIDVMLFLLVFFIIVTLQMIPDSGLSMHLPTSSQTQHLKHPKFTINILTNGTIQIKKPNPHPQPTYHNPQKRRQPTPYPGHHRRLQTYSLPKLHHRHGRRP